MGFFNRWLQLKTGAKGNFFFVDARGDFENPKPDADGFNLLMKAKLKDSRGASAKCTFIFGNGSNQGREFTLEEGKWIDLGSWHAGQDKVYLIEISGVTDPPRPYSEIKIDLETEAQSNS